MIRQAAAERAERERADGRLLILLGVPFALGGWFGLTVGLWLVQLPAWTVLPWSLGTAFWIAAALALAAIVADCILHPVEEWHRARYYMTDGTAAGDTGDAYGLAHGAFDGMPLMASATDPGNLAERGKVISSGCANVVLAGPRNIRKGLAKLALARRRSEPRLVASAEAFVAWLAERGQASPQDVAQAIASNSRWRRGVALAFDLGVVRSVRGADGQTSFRTSTRGQG